MKKSHSPSPAGACKRICANHFAQFSMRFVLRMLGVSYLAAMVLLWPKFACGQEISAGISAREAWVGAPIVFQLQVTDGKVSSFPESFSIDQCEVRSAGNPSRSSHVTIFNGRRSENTVTRMRYLITPQEEGEFLIPALEIEVNGEIKKTRPIRFVATKSESGDLMFVEAKGEEDSVFVGQPLKINLKIWVKPFVDRKSNVVLNPSHMWQLLADQTSWGPFEQSIVELANRRQIPKGESVLREDEKGRSREYYLYELSSTVYPTKPGKIDGSDIKVVLNYPTELKQRGGGFDSLVGNGMFGGRSQLQRMMNDDLFASPFGRRLVVSQSRPVVVDAVVESTEVLPIPSLGRPADYRGAVGRYQLITQTETTSVAAGDPITLRIGVVGDGPMELVQAPPLHQIESLTSDFQVSDEALAGFVQDDTKVFITTIRPRDENVTRIPPIPFSFFDPQRKTFQTVYSDPIDIDVQQADALQLDAIVSDAYGGSSTEEKSEQVPGGAETADDETQAKAFSYAAAVKTACYVALGLLALLLIVVLSRFSKSIPVWLRRLRSPISIAKQGLVDAHDESELVSVLQRFVADLTGARCPTFAHAVGRVRAMGDYQTAGQLESLQLQVDRSQAAQQWGVSEEIDVSKTRQICLTLIDAVEQAWSTRRKLR